MITNEGPTQPQRQAKAVGKMPMLMISAGPVAALAAALFLSSGRLDWGMAWVYICLRVTVGATGMLMIASRHPGLLDERFHPAQGAKAWDRPLTGISSLLTLIMLFVAGLDIRFGWSPEPAISIRLAALIVWLSGDVFSRWAAISNRFYSRAVRIQKDRGHTVVTEGPYRYVRHPGYAGAPVAGLAAPIMLGSLWALVAGAALAFVLVPRTAFEDRTLLEELPGYTDYAQRTRHRLVPRVW
jgi:protein-S-isoprenylcysteine O-methyltransferase Ste14